MYNMDAFKLLLNVYEHKLICYVTNEDPFYCKDCVNELGLNTGAAVVFESLVSKISII